MKKQILIMTKHPRSKGGVVNYYNNFFSVFDNPNYKLKWFTIGSRPKDYLNRENRSFAYMFEFIRDVFLYFLLITNRNIRIVQVNPSFTKVPLIRDSIFVLIARVFNRKTIIFIRGWSKEFELNTNLKSILYKIIFRLFNKSDKILVLAEKFKKTLIDLGISDEIVSVTRTMYKESDIQLEKNSNNNQLKLIYLGRLSQQKGVLDIIESLKIIRNKKLNISIDLYGHFSNDEIKKSITASIKKYNLESIVNLNGFVAGKEKYEALSKADIFLFPSYDEGCPNSIIEALASNLFVISTPVGAIDEIVEHKKNGLIVPVNSPEILANKIIWCFDNLKKVKLLAKKNGSYASVNFEQKIILSQINKIYNNLY